MRFSHKKRHKKTTKFHLILPWSSGASIEGLTIYFFLTFHASDKLYAMQIMTASELVQFADVVVEIWGSFISYLTIWELRPTSSWAPSLPHSWHTWKYNPWPSCKMKFCNRFTLLKIILQQMHTSKHNHMRLIYTNVSPTDHTQDGRISQHKMQDLVHWLEHQALLARSS